MVAHRLLILLAFSSLSVFGQELSTLSGHLIDIQTRNPIPSIHILLASTTRSAVTKDDGSYLIEGIQPGKYDLVVFINGDLPRLPGVFKQCFALWISTC
jgi:hypothetical protein